jgi:hypothetical protein
MPDQNNPYAEFGGQIVGRAQDTAKDNNPFAEFGGEVVGRAPQPAHQPTPSADPFAIPSQQSQVATPVTDTYERQQILNQPHAVSHHYQPHVPQVKPIEDGWGGAFIRDLKTSPLLQGIVKNTVGALGGAAKLLGDYSDVMGSGVPASHLIPIGNSTGIGEAADKAEFHAGFNVNNTKNESDQVYDYLHSKGLNPNDASQVADYLSNNHTPDDQRALTYFGGDEWLKKQKDHEFNIHKATNSLGDFGKQLWNGTSGLLEMAPQFVGGVPAFVVDGYGKTQQYLDNSPQAANLSNNEKKAISLAGGGVNALADLLHLPLAKAVNEKIAPVIAKEAVADLARSGEKLTAESLAKATADKAYTYAQKLKAGGVQQLKNLLFNTGVAGAMSGANLGIHAATNALAGDQVYHDVNENDFLSSLENNAAQFAIPSLFGLASRPLAAMLPKEQRNYFAQKVAEAKTDTDIDNLKAETAAQGQQMGMPEQQINNALSAIDAYAQLKRKMPGMSPMQTNEVLGLMDQRNQLQSKLRSLEDQRESTDDLFKSHIDGQISTAKVNLESLEDQIRAKASGNPIHFTEQDGHYFKDDGQGPIPITKDRYDFEKIMAEADKPLEQKATEQGINHLDNLINEHENATQQISQQEGGQPEHQNRNESGQTEETGDSHSPVSEAESSSQAEENEHQPGQGDGQENENQGGLSGRQENGPQGPISSGLPQGVSEKEITYTAPDADGLIRKALKAQPGETIEVNGQVFKVLESAQSDNRQSGEAKIVRLIDGKPDEETGPIEITQRSDARNSDRQHDNQNNISSATRLSDGRYSFGQGIRASANIDNLVESLNNGNSDTGNNRQDDNTVAASGNEGTTEVNHTVPSETKSFEPNSWSARFNEIPEDNRQQELENEVVKAKEVIKQLKDRDKVNTKADAVIRRIRELADHKLIDKAEAEKQIEEVDRFRDHKLDHLPEGQKKNEARDVTRDVLGDDQQESDLTTEDGQLDLDKVISGLKTHENPEAVSEAMDSHAEAVGLGQDSLIDRAIKWVDDTIDTEKSKRGKRSDSIYSTVIPPAIGREIGIGALKAMRTALAATKSFSEAYKAAMKHLKAAGLDDKTIEEGRRWLHELFAGLKASHIKDFVEEQKLERKDREKMNKALSAMREKSKAILKLSEEREKWQAKAKEREQELKAAHKERLDAEREHHEAKTDELKAKAKERLDKAKERHEAALENQKDKFENRIKQAKYNYEIARQAIKDAVKDFKEQTNGKKLPFTAGDITKLTKLASGTLNPAQADKVINELKTVLGKAQTNKLLTDTEGLAKKVAKIIRHNKTSPTEQQVFSRLNNIKAGNLRDIDGNIDHKSLTKLNKALRDIVESHKDVSVTKDDNGDYSLIHEQKANHDYLNTVADELEPVQNAHLDRMDEQRAQDLLDELEGNGAISTAGLSANELATLKQAIKDGSLPKLIELNENKKLTDLAEKIDAAENKSSLLQDHIKDLVQQSMGRSELDQDSELPSRIKTILQNGIKTDELSNSELVRLHRVLSRMAENGDLTKAHDLVVLSEREQAISAIKDIMGGRGTKLGKVAAGVHLPIALDVMFKDFKKAARFMVATHLQGWNNGHVEAKMELEHVAHESQKLLGKASADDSRSITKGYSSLRRGVIAYLLQHYGGTPEDINMHFNDLSVANLDQSIRYLESSSGDKTYRQQAEWLKQIRTELLDGVNSYEDFVNRVNENHSGDLAVVQHWIDAFAKHKQELSDIELILNGNQIDTGIHNYTSTKVVDAGEREQHEHTQIGEGYADNRKYINKKSAGTTISRDLQPIKNGYLDFDFDRLQPKRFNETLMQIKMQTEAKIMDAIVKDPRFQQTVFPDSKQSQKRFYNFLVDTDKARLGAGGQSQSELSQSLNRAIDRVQQFSAIRTLGSFGQIFNQVPSVAINTAGNLGMDSGLLGKGIRDAITGDAAEFLDKASTSLRHSNKVSYATTITAAERGSHLNALNRHLISALNSAGVNIMPESLSKQIAQYSMDALGRSDQMIAHASYLAYYLKYLKDKGINLDELDWKQQAEHPDMEGMAYAQHMVDRTQAPSDRTLMAQWLRPNSPFARIAIGMMMPYYNFNMNAKFRSAADLNKIIFGSPEEKMQGVRSLGATVAESVTFAAMKRYVTGAIGAGAAYMIAGAIGQGQDDDKRKLTDIYHGPDQAQQVLGSAAQDVFYGGLPAADILGYGTNKLYTAVMGQEPKISNTTGKASLQDRQLMYTSLGGNKVTKKDMLDQSLGMYAPAADLILDDYTRLSDLHHGYKEVTDLTGKTKQVPMTDYEKSITKLALYKDLITLSTGAQDALVHRPVEKEYQRVMSDMQLNYYDGIKRIAKAIHYHESKFGLGNAGNPKLGQTAVEVDHNRDIMESSPDAKELNHDYAFYMKNAADLGKLMGLNAAMVQSGKPTKELRELFETEGKRVQKALNTGSEYHLSDETFHTMLDKLKTQLISGAQPDRQHIIDQIEELRKQAKETTDNLPQN